MCLFDLWWLVHSTVAVVLQLSRARISCTLRGDTEGRDGTKRTQSLATEPKRGDGPQIGELSDLACCMLHCQCFIVIFIHPSTIVVDFDCLKSVAFQSHVHFCRLQPSEIFLAINIVSTSHISTCLNFFCFLLSEKNGEMKMTPASKLFSTSSLTATDKSKMT